MGQARWAEEVPASAGGSHSDGRPAEDGMDALQVRLQAAGG
jgi:hypothetical protein